MEFTRCGSGGGLGLGFGLLLRLGVAFRLRLVVGLFLLGLFLRRLGALVLEVGRVPAAALQLEARSAQKLLEGRLAAYRALGERRLGILLYKILLVDACLAAIFIDLHSVIISCLFQK